MFIGGAIVLSLVICAGMGELLTRLFFKHSLVADEKTLSYEYDSELGWRPIPNSAGRFTGSVEINFRHNKDGFRDQDHGPKSKPRIAVMGDSYVWGYDAEAEDRFTDKLQKRISDWEVLNMGVSGYATDQELLVARKWFDVYQPNVVVLVFSDNDTPENALNLVHGGYYKPYFEFAGGRLTLEGVPVPKGLPYYAHKHPWLGQSRLWQFLVWEVIRRRAPVHVSAVNPTLALILQLKAYAESKGAQFVLGYVDEFNGDRKRAFAEKLGVDYLFLLDGPHLTTEFFYPTHGNHWKPKGHDLACNRLVSFLTTNRSLEARPEPGQRRP